MPENFSLNNPLNYLGVRAPTPPNFIRSKRSPETEDINYDLGTIWLNTESLEIFCLTRVKSKVATWFKFISSVGNGIETLTGDIGGAISPIAGNVNLEGKDLYTVEGSGNTLTITETPGAYPATPFVVGAPGQAGYQTIQSALDAADAGGEGVVLVQPGNYNENLTLRSDIAIKGLAQYENSGTSNGVQIIGQHTPPTNGFILIENVGLSNSDHIISSSAAGSSEIRLKDVQILFTTGSLAFIFDLPNWTGPLGFYNVQEFDGESGQSGVINNSTGTSVISIRDSQVGGGSGGTTELSANGNLNIEHSEIGCGVVVGSSSIIDIRFTIFSRNLHLTGSSSGSFHLCSWHNLSVVGITMDTLNPVVLSQCIIDTVAGNAIDGTGLGVIALEDVSFLNTSSVGGTVIVFKAGLTRNGRQLIKELQIPEAGADPTLGIAILVAGTVVVPTTAVTATSRIFLSHDTFGGTAGLLSVSARTPTVNFTITSSTVGDTSTVIWHIIQGV